LERVWGKAEVDTKKSTRELAEATHKFVASSSKNHNHSQSI
jgi:hypothetical protein